MKKSPLMFDLLSRVAVQTGSEDSSIGDNVTSLTQWVSEFWFCNTDRSYTLVTLFVWKAGCWQLTMTKSPIECKITQIQDAVCVKVYTGWRTAVDKLNPNLFYTLLKIFTNMRHVCIVYIHMMTYHKEFIMWRYYLHTIISESLFRAECGHFRGCCQSLYKPAAYLINASPSPPLTLPSIYEGKYDWNV